VQRRARPRADKIAADLVVRQSVQERLEKWWSPQQVSQAPRREIPGDAARHVVHETIYQGVYRPELGGLSRDLRPGRCVPQVAAQAAPPSGRAAAERDHRHDHGRSAASWGPLTAVRPDTGRVT
jgi:IS30 family transposase